MAELGLDIPARSPKKLTDEMALRADVIVTMGCGDECPVYPGKRYVDWELPTPPAKSSTRSGPSVTTLPAEWGGSSPSSSMTNPLAESRAVDDLSGLGRRHRP